MAECPGGIPELKLLYNTPWCYGKLPLNCWDFYLTAYIVCVLSFRHTFVQ